MSDKIHRGPWGDRTDESGGSGSEPPDGSLARRVTSLELEVKVSFARIEAALSNVATKTDVAGLTERIRGTEDRAGRLEKAVDSALTAAISKSIGWWQFPLVLAGSAAVLIAAAAALNWLLDHGYFPHSP